MLIQRMKMLFIVACPVEHDNAKMNRPLRPHHAER